MRWFRLYNEFAHDPKMQTMSETFQRRYIMLLCLKCNGDLLKLTEEEIAFALRITPEELQKTKETFIKKCFIDDSWNILNWDKRQYVSDTSTERVRKHREKQSETLQKRSETVTVTPPEQIQNRTDTEQIQNRKRNESLMSDSCVTHAQSKVKESKVKEKKLKETNSQKRDGFEEFWKAYPRKVNKREAENRWNKKENIPDLKTILTAIEQQKQTEQWQKDGGQYIPHPTTWINQERWNDEVQKETRASPQPKTYGQAKDAERRELFKRFQENKDGDVENDTKRIDQT